MDRIRSPYNFVPVSPRVAFPDWAQLPLQDTPFEDGACGSIEVELTAKTPIFTRGGSKAEFFRLPDGTHAIPGSAWRGLLRNVFEIAAFGKLQRFNDHRYSVRDLQNRELYLDHMAALMSPRGGGNKVPMPLVDAGWLTRIDDGEGNVVAQITPCDFAKIHYTDLMNAAKARGITGFNPGRRQSAAEKYRSWGAPDGDEGKRLVDVSFTPIRESNPRFLSQFGRIVMGGRYRGTLVFTGQPQPWVEHDPRNKAKRNDFVFFEPAPHANPIPVGFEAFRDFEFVHSDRGQQGRMVEGHLAPNEEWGFWKNLFDRDSPGRVPVFFLRDSNGSRGSGKLRAMGLAMMFRLACDRSVRDAVENAQFQACTTKLDLADLVFGAVLKGKNSDKTGVERDVTVARRGRVSFGVMHAQGTPRAGKPVRDVVLGSPKASYYPNYVEQGQGFAELPSRDGARYRYKTFMNEDVRIRGWKRYRPQDTVRTAPAPRRGDGSTMDLSRVGTSFTPLDAGTRFRGLIRIHNLRPVELGALLWSLDFGESEDCFHTFGLARSLGYGKVRLGITTTNLSANDGSGVDLGACREAFADWMDAQLSDLPGKWRESEQIRHLVELAKSVPVTSDEARHMLLKHPQHRNEFLEAKRLGLALAPIGRPQTRAPSSAETSRPQHGAPRREVRRAGFSGISAPMPVPAGPTRTWSGIKGGTRVKAKLIGMSKRGKWQVELTDHPAQGVVGLGDAPPDLEMGGIVEVVVTGGGNPTNLVLRWP